MRLISADKTISELSALPEQERLEYMGVYDLIKSIPTIDAEPVVCCKNCKHWKQEESHTGNNGASFCKCGWFSSYQNVNGGIYTSKDDFCSYGAKMDEEVKQK